MYVSKHYTCAEIDQRLLQGYYDDAVSAGFVGTLKEFWAFVLSIKDKPGTEEVSGLLESLEQKLKKAIDAVQGNLDTSTQDLNTRIDNEVESLEQKIEAQKVTKVSELENDAKYQTEEQVKAYISALVNGADESLDTLLELAQALGNDPNFAATITQKLGDLKTALQDEVNRAKEKEAELKTALETEIAKREEGDAKVIKLAEDHVTRLSKALQDSFTALDGKLTTIQSQFTDLQNSFHDLSTEVNQKVEAAKAEAKTDNNALKTELTKAITDGDAALDTKITQEVTRATDAEGALDTKITDLTTKVSANEKAIQDEAAARQAADIALNKAVTDEANARTTADADLQAKLTQENLDRLQGDTDNDTKIVEETAARKEADSALSVSLNTEKTERQNADATLRNDLDNLGTKHDNELNTLNQAITQEVSRAKAAEGGKVDKKEGYGLSKNDLTDPLLAKLNGIQDQANYITKVSELINDSGFLNEAEVDAAIQAVIGAAPETLNTLQEIAAALGDDPNFAGTILNRIAAVTTQLNEEIDNRKAADDTLKLELLAKIKESADALNNSYAILEERLSTYKSLCDQQNTATNARIDSLETSLNEKVQMFLDKVTEISTAFNEKVNELNAKVNKFTTDILARITAQDDLIQGNSTNIQRNLELIQGLTGQITEIKDNANKNLNQMLEAIRAEANTRKTADDALGSRIDQTQQDLAALIANTYNKAEVDTKILNATLGDVDVYTKTEIDAKLTGMVKVQKLTQEEYDALETKDENVLYAITNPDPDPTDTGVYVNPESLSFSVAQNATSPTKTIKVTGVNLTTDISTSSATRYITVTQGSDWNARTGGTLSVTVDTSRAPGTYEGGLMYIAVQSTTTYRKQIPVTVTITEPTTQG